MTSPDLLDAAPADTAGAAVVPGRRRARESGVPFGTGSRTTLGVVVLFVGLLVLLPLVGVVGKAFDRGLGGFWDAISSSTPRDAIVLTVVLSVLVALVNAVVGLGVAWVLVRDRFRGAWLLEFVIDIPFALPTVVAGVVMLALYNDDSPVGISLFGSRASLVVILLFVTLPFTVRTVQPVLVDLDRDAEQAAASLGASPFTVFRRIIAPQLYPAMSSGAALAFARALGEYGSLVFLSNAIPHKTLVASMYIYGKTQDNDNPALADQQASAVAFVLLIASALVLVLLDVLQRTAARRG